MSIPTTFVYFATTRCIYSSRCAPKSGVPATAPNRTSTQRNVLRLSMEWPHHSRCDSRYLTVYIHLRHFFLYIHYSKQSLMSTRLFYDDMFLLAPFPNGLLRACVRHPLLIWLFFFPSSYKYVRAIQSVSLLSLFFFAS